MEWADPGEQSIRRASGNPQSVDVVDTSDRLRPLHDQCPRNPGLLVVQFWIRDYPQPVGRFQWIGAHHRPAGDVPRPLAAATHGPLTLARARHWVREDGCAAQVEWLSRHRSV